MLIESRDVPFLIGRLGRLHPEDLSQLWLVQT